MTTLRQSFADAWENTLTKLGTAYASLSWHTPVAAIFLTYETLKSLYIDDSIARRIVVEPVEDGFAKGVELTPPEGLDTEPAQREEKLIRAALERLGVLGKLQGALVWGRLHGRAGLLLGTGDTERLEEPLPDGTDLLTLRVLDLEDFSVSRVATEGDLYGEPDVWRVTQETGGSQLVHASRILLTGAIPTERKTRRDNEWRDIPVLQSVYQDLRNYNSTKTSVAQMLVDSSQAVLKVLNLPQVLADNGQLLRERMRILELAKALHIMLINAGDMQGKGAEDFSFVERTFSGVGDAFDRIMGALSSSAGWPQTKLYGRSPAGENATGESDLVMWDDLVLSEQTRSFAPLLQRIVDLVVQTEGLTEGWTAGFPPLRQMTEAEQATLRKTVTETDAINIDRGVFAADTVAQQRGGGDAPDFSPIMLSDDDKKTAETSRSLGDPVELEIAEGPARDGAEDIQKTAYNGAQVDKGLSVVTMVARRELPRDAALGALKVFYRMTDKEALTVLASVGKTWFATEEEDDGPGEDAPQGEDDQDDEGEGGRASDRAPGGEDDRGAP